MNRDFASSNAALVEGYAWHVYPDPAGSGALAGDHPFATGDAPADDEAGPTLAPPDGVINFWTVLSTSPGILNNPERTGQLVVTEAAEPPRVNAGWDVEAARLTPDFQVDQRGDRWLRLVRIVREVETRWGPLAYCEFQVDRT